MEHKASLYGVACRNTCGEIYTLYTRALVKFYALSLTITAISKVTTIYA